METFASLIDTFGIGTVAEILGVRRSHVWTMRTRNAVPPLHWGALIAAAPKYNIDGLDFDRCRALYDARKTPEALAEPTPSDLQRAG